MKFKTLIIIVSIFFFLSAKANTTQQKNGYKIEVSAPFKKGSMAYFAYYWEGTSYATDSVAIPQNGIFEFVSTEKNLATGQYLLYIKPDIQIELLIDANEQSNIKINLNKDKLVNSTISGSNDTKLFWNYLAQAEKLDAKINELKTALADEKIDDKTKKENTKAYLKAEEEKVKFTNKQIEENKDSWFAAIANTSRPINLPHPLPEFKEQRAENGKYAKKHYFDNIDLADIRMWNTNIITPYIDRYLQNWVAQHPDSIAKEASWIVNQTKNNDATFQKTLSYLSNQAMTSSVMGMENTWAKLAEDHIFDKNISWIDSTQYNDLKAEYSLIQHNRIGMKAQNLNLLTVTADSISTNSIDAEYTILYFYSTSCSHCRHEMPLLRNNFFEKNKDLGLKVVAINLDRNIEAWKSFMHEFDMQNVEGWTNAFDPNYKSEYWMKYNTSGTPSLYLLAKDKTILGKKLDIEHLDIYFDRITNRK